MVLWTTPMEKWLILILYLTTVWWQLHYSCFKRAWVQLRAIFSHINGGQKKADKLLSQKSPWIKGFKSCYAWKEIVSVSSVDITPLHHVTSATTQGIDHRKFAGLWLQRFFADKKKRQGGKQYCFSASFIYSMEIFHRIYRNSFGY